MLTWLQAVVLGVIEGVTEFLPISSTAHLILASDLLKISSSEFLKSFEIIIQSGAILAVLALYWRKLLDWEILKRIAVAFVPTGAVGLIFYKTVKHYLLGNTQIVLWSLFLGGILLVVLEHFFSKRDASSVRNKQAGIKKMSYKQCLAVGCFQSAAIVPGVSRSAATIMGGLALGISRQTIVEFSFLLALPTMLAATGLDLVKNSGILSQGSLGILLIGLATSFVLALLAIRWLLKFVQGHRFAVFGIYRVALVILFLLFAAVLH